MRAFYLIPACLCFWLACCLRAGAQPVSGFTSITGDLVNNEVTSIVQDPNGFIWLGTRGGLQRYDGYELKLLQNDFTRGDNLRSQSIEVLLPGRDQGLWIGTKSGGLSRYDWRTGLIHNYIYAGQNPSEFNADYMLSLLECGTDTLLLGSWQGFGWLHVPSRKLHIIHPRWKTFDIQPDGSGGYWLATSSGLRHLTRDLKNDRSYDFGIVGINITSVVRDTRRGCLWLGTWDQGLIRFDATTGDYRFYRHQPGRSGVLRNNNTYRLLLDRHQQLWVGTWGGGLHCFDPEREWFSPVRLQPAGLFSNDDRIILSLMQDPSGLLWVGTDGAGVYKYDLNQKQFYNIGYNSSPTLQGGTHILSVFTDPFQKLWVSTKGGCIQYSRNGSDFNCIHFQSPFTERGLSNAFEARCYLQDGDSLWIGTSKGLIRIRNTGATPGHYELILPRAGDSLSISGRKINALLKDAAGNIWVGTQENGLSSISGYDAQGRPQFVNYKPAFGQQGALQNERVSCLLLDSKQRLWVGTYKGLHLYDAATDGFRVFFQNAETNRSISNNTILCLAEDGEGQIWAGTQNGLNRISDVSGDKLMVESYGSRDGLPSSYIHAIIPDSQGHIWASTNKGIVRWKMKEKAVAVFDKRDGIGSVVFSENASHRDAKGRFYFGGLEGLTYFDPDSIRISRFAPPVYFTNLWINNQKFEYLDLEGGEGSPERQPVFERKQITLNHRENILMVEFAALDFHAPDKNEYRYKLEGFQDVWVNAGNKRSVSFTNLKPGRYRLMVQASNSDKLWNEQVQILQIRILPPPWKTWWAYTLYVALFLFLLWLTRHLGLRQEALKTQLQLSKLARQQEKELAEYKERLFTNISHEFRTPLTLILGPMEDLLQRRKFEKPVEKSLLLVQKQSKRMLRMVNQLLDYQKAQAGSLKLSRQPGEIVSFCRDIFLLFQEEANRRQMQYTLETEEKYLSFAFDHNKLDIIVFNILSNAFKYTPDGGSISMRIRKMPDQSVSITVADTGAGIATSELEAIFGRFYRGEETDASTISGTGIGLSFVKELTELHGGTIKAESDGKTGSVFTVLLPPPDEKPNGTKLPEAWLPVLETKSVNSHNAEYMQEETENLPRESEEPIILVVEDEADMREYISEILAPSYQIVTAVNGEEGLEKAMEIIPDLIVSDIMMPGIDGIELCRRLKSDKSTSHIPIILLTALSDMTHHVQGIREGADVYLPKPFNSQLLLVHIHNLINIRNTLKELYAKKVFLGTSNFEIKSFEEEFLYKLVKLVEDNISNSQFNNDELANLMFMSRSTFYRKLKAVTGMSGNEFIRTTRLNYAAKLLESGKYSVTEAAYESGFNDIKYFRKRFQDQFGVIPSEYKKQ